MRDFWPFGYIWIHLDCFGMWPLVTENGVEIDPQKNGPYVASDVAPVAARFALATWEGSGRVGGQARSALYWNLFMWEDNHQNVGIKAFVRSWRVVDLVLRPTFDDDPNWIQSWNRKASSLVPTDSHRKSLCISLGKYPVHLLHSVIQLLASLEYELPKNHVGLLPQWPTEVFPRNSVAKFYQTTKIHKEWMLRNPS